MKRIELVIDLDTLDRFTEAAKALNLSAFDVTEVRRMAGSSSHDRQRLYRAREFVLDLVERLKVDLTVADDAAMQIARDLIERVRPESIAILRLDHAVVATSEATVHPTRIAATPNPPTLVAAG
jgi:nitrogen regulatory protein P-II 1